MGSKKTPAGTARVKLQQSGTFFWIPSPFAEESAENYHLMEEKRSTLVFPHENILDQYKKHV